MGSGKESKLEAIEEMRVKRKSEAVWSGEQIRGHRGQERRGYQRQQQSGVGDVRAEKETTEKEGVEGILLGSRVKRLQTRGDVEDILDSELRGQRRLERNLGRKRHLLMRSGDQLWGHRGQEGIKYI